MSMMLLAAAAALAVPSVSHQATVEHRGAQLNVAYVADAQASLKTVGVNPPARAGMPTCRWTATVAVDRQVANLETRLPGALELSGQRPGDCLTARTAIADEIAGKSEAIRAHLVSVAAADRPKLMSDLDAARALAAN